MDESKSKSQLKREAQLLQKLGVTLIGLSHKKLDLLPLPDNLKQAITSAKSLKSHGAMRRQAQLIGKLMRAADSEQIIRAYEDMMANERADTAEFHQLESWRERLISEGRPALTAFIEMYSPEDIQQLRQLIKKAVDERQNEKNTGASKALFRFLRACV